ncbi:MAG: chemotaxis protein CheR [Sphaerospermopsis sp. SIO1G2]|nr:chemotaxis protein CheR [Sphaerospermopsis sp. SIO1G2]
MTIQPGKSAQSEFSFTDRDFTFIVDFVKKKTGIALDDNKRPMVYSRLSRRLRLLQLTSFTQYCELLRSKDGEAEVPHLVNAITTNLTHFFREEHHFDHLRSTVLEPLIASSRDKRLRIWSAGCSSGAEPYSIAMVVHHLLARQQGWDCKILATDIDSNMLEIGRTGLYSAEACERIPSPYGRYAHSAANEQKMMDDALKQLTFFKQLNLMESWPMRGIFDVIFCRNVVIYFDKDTQRQLFARMAKLLRSEGWLYIGHSESLHNVSQDFVLRGKTTYQKTS